MSSAKATIITSIITSLLVSFTIIYAFTSDTDKSVSSRDTHTEETATEPEFSVTPVDYRRSLSDSISFQRHNIITETVKNVSPAVVGIDIKEIRQYRSPWSNDPFWRHFFGSGVYNKRIQGIGTGIVISSDGYIVTNDHVAGKADEILVTLSNGDQFKAEIVGTDLTTDICLLKIDAKDLPYVKFGNSDDIMIGEWSIAIGNPFGLFSLTDNPTVTVGVVSAVGMNLSSKDDRYYMNMIQTDASINQGNSGGPLVNSIGEMIGMNTIIYTAQGSTGNVGVGFAIPVNKVNRIVNELQKNGKVDRNYWTGLTVRDVDQGLADYFDLSRARGVIINDLVKNSPADEAGLEVYDIITEINGYKINNSDVLLGILQDYKTGDEITFTILREGKIYDISMKLEQKA